MGLEGMLDTGDKTILIAVIFAVGRNNTCKQYLVSYGPGVQEKWVCFILQ